MATRTRSERVSRAARARRLALDRKSRQTNQESESNSAEPQSKTSTKTTSVIHSQETKPSSLWNKNSAPGSQRRIRTLAAAPSSRSFNNNASTLKNEFIGSSIDTSKSLPTSPINTPALVTPSSSHFVDLDMMDFDDMPMDEAHHLKRSEQQPQQEQQQENHSHFAKGSQRAAKLAREHVMNKNVNNKNNRLINNGNKSKSNDDKINSNSNKSNSTNNTDKSNDSNDNKNKNKLNVLIVSNPPGGFQSKMLTKLHRQGQQHRESRQQKQTPQPQRVISPGPTSPISSLGPTSPTSPSEEFIPRQPPSPSEPPHIPTVIPQTVFAASINRARRPIAQRRKQAFSPQRANQTAESPPPPPPPIQVIVDAADRGGGHLPVVPQQPIKPSPPPSGSSLKALTEAIKLRSKRPDNLSKEEETLWAAMQSSLQDQRAEWGTRKRMLERKIQDTQKSLEKLQDEFDKEGTEKLINSLKQELRETKSSQKEAIEEAQRLSAIIAETEAFNAKLVQETEAAVSSKEKAANDLMSKAQSQHKRALDKSKEAKELMSQAMAHKEMVEALLVEQQEEHDKAIRAMRRVLADVTGEREEMEENLKNRIKTLEEERELYQAVSAENDEKDWEEEKKAWGEERKALEEERQAWDAEKKSWAKEKAKLQRQLQEATIQQEGTQHRQTGSQESEMEEALDKAKADLKERDKKEENLKRLIQEQLDTGDKLREELEQTQLAYENAKMLIASMESANGSMAAENRHKLREKDETIMSLQGESAGRKRMLDNLATDLKNLQIEKSKTEHFIESIKQQHAKQNGLISTLDSAMNDLEATKDLDPTSEGDKSEKLVANALASIKTCLSSLEGRDETASNISFGEFSLISDSSTGVLEPKELQKQLDVIIRSEGEIVATGLRQELEEKNTSISYLEQQLEAQKLRTKIARQETSELLESKELAEAEYLEEIRQLREEQVTNLEALSKKQQELQVLRESLDPSDGVGYISGDDTEDEEMVRTHGLSTFFVQTGIEVTETPPTPSELDALRKRIMALEVEKDQVARELKTEKHSLTNAKMIISSLEKANKTMLEDLRCRLQDSNSAVASLLDKSIENEKLSKNLSDQLEQMKKEKEETEIKYMNELRKRKEDEQEEEEKKQPKEGGENQQETTEGVDVKDVRINES